jgi:hypothetical protein
MFFPVIILYVLYIFFFETKRNISFLLEVACFILLGFILSAFYWIPSFFEGKYTLRDIVTKGETVTRFVPFSAFLYSPWNYGGGNDFTKSVGIVQLVGVAAALWVWGKEREKKTRLFIGGMALVFVFSLIMMTSASLPVWNAISILQKFQFPWRFLSITVFASACMGGYSLVYVLRHVTADRKQFRAVCSALCVVIIGITYPMWFPKENSMRPEAYYMGIYEGTTDTGESSPIWSVRFMEHRPNAPLERITGAVSVTALSRTTTVRTYAVYASSPSRVVENTLYFPGWNVYVDGKATGIQYQDPAYRGLMTFEIPQGNHSVQVVFGNTKIRSLSQLLSLSGGMMVLVLLGVYALWTKKK